MKIFIPILILALYSCGGGGGSMSSNSNEVGAGSSGSSGGYGGSYGSSSSGSQSSSSSLEASTATINGIDIIQISGANEESNMGGSATNLKRSVYAYSNDDDSVATYVGNAWPRVRLTGTDITVSSSVSAQVTKLTDASDSTNIVGINFRPTYQCSVDMYDYDADCEDSNWRLFLPNGSVNLEDSESVPETTQSFTITVQSTDSGNKFYVDGVLAKDLTLERGKTYSFVQADSYTSHPLRFSIEKNGLHASKPEFIRGVKTSKSNNTIYITVPSDAPDQLYYFCFIHSGMANDAVITITD